MLCDCCNIDTSVSCFARELRIACTIAQMEREGGISPRMSPLAQVFYGCLFILLCLFYGPNVLKNKAHLEKSGHAHMPFSSALPLFSNQARLSMVREKNPKLLN